MAYEGRINTTEVSRQNENYKDLDLDFMKHPATGDLVKKRGAEAIRRSLRNLLFLNKGELPFNPNKGAGIYHRLFELYTPATVELLKQEITNMAQVFEPRAQIFAIDIEEEQNNGLNITIHFHVINYNEPVSLNVFLERVR